MAEMNLPHWNFEKMLASRSPVNTMFESEWFTQWRNSQTQNFNKNSFPNHKQEDWRYTNILPIVNTSFNFANKADWDVDISFFVQDVYRIVFVNGFYQPHLSGLNGLPDGVELMPLSQALKQKNDWQTYFENNNVSSFQQLNAVLMTDGFVLRVSPRIIVDKPIHLLYLSASDNDAQMTHPRNIIVCGEGCEVTIFEEYSDRVAVAPSSIRKLYFNNVVTMLFAEKNAQVNHYKLQNETESAFHIANMSIHQKKDSMVNTFHFALGSRLGRDDLHYCLNEANAQCKLIGFYYLNGERHIDNHSRIDHLASHTTSEQHYRGILTDRGCGVFNGKVIVHPAAPKTSAKQSNKNLLLSKMAEMNTKPELEIYMDDVQCTHGATVGQLDEASLFYLQSRGIEKSRAEAMLTNAFVDELFHSVPNLTILNYVQDRIKEKMGTDIRE